MANALFNKGKEAILSDLDFSAATIKALLVGSGYAVSLTTDQYVADLPPDQILARSATVTGKGVTDGVATADNGTWSSVGGTDDGAYIVVYEDTGSDATSRLLAYVDTAVGLPITPNGGDIQIAWDVGPNKIFHL